MRLLNSLILLLLLLPLAVHAEDVKTPTRRRASDTTSPAKPRRGDVSAPKRTRHSDSKSPRARKPIRSKRTKISKPKLTAPLSKPAPSPPHAVTHDWLSQRIAAERHTLQQSLESWDKLRSRKIAIVPTMGRLDLTRSLKENLGARYKLMLSKQRSNRQWSAYWESEATLSQDLSTRFNRLSGLGNLLIDVLEDVIGYLRRTLTTRLLEIRMANGGLDGQLQLVAARLADLRQQEQARTSALETLAAALKTAQTAQVAAKAKLEEAKRGTDKALIAQAETALSTADAALKKASEAHAEGKKALQESQALVATASIVAAALRRKPHDVLEKKVKTLIEQLASATQTRNREWLTLLKTTDKITARHGELAKDRALSENGGADKTHRYGKAHDQSKRELERANLRLDKAITAHQAALRELRAALDTQSSELASALTELATLQQRSAQTKKLVAFNQDALAKAKASKDRTTERSASRTLRKLLKQQARETAKAAELAQTIAESKQIKQQLSQYWAILQLSPVKTGDGVFDNAVQTWLTTQRTIEDTRDRVRNEADQLLATHRRRIDTSIWTRRLSGRQHALREWHALAETKRTNQRAYLRAITINITAVEDRLRRLDERTTSKNAPTKPGTEEDFEDSTPYRSWKRSLRSLKNQRLRRYRRLREEEENLRLFKGRMDSAQQLKAAQTKDLVLLKTETTVAQQEHARSVKSAFETADWRKAWTHYEAKALGKHATLKADLAATNQLIDELKNEQRLIELALTAHKDAIKDLKKRIGATEDRSVRVWLSTAWEWLRSNVWDVPLAILLTLLALRFVGFTDRRIMARAEAKRAEDRAAVQQVQTLSSIITSVLKIVIIGGFVLWFLSKLGINVAPLLGGAAILGLAISFGSQNLVRDVVTGFFILLEKQYTVGDFIEVGGIWGEVEMLTLRRTVIRSRDGKAHIIPNGEIKMLSNLTMGWSRAVLHIGVSYSSDLNFVKKVVNETCDALWSEPSWRVKLLEAPKYIGLSEMADSALVIRVMGKTKPFQHWEVELELNHRLKEAFDAAEIVIPFPQRDVHMYHHPADETK